MLCLKETIFQPSKPEVTDGLYQLNDQTFYRHIQSGDHFVKFYAPWCSHCSRLAPTWADLARHFEIDPLVTIARLDCTKSESVCHDNEVRGYPTLQYFRDGERIAIFRGNRHLEDLTNFVVENKVRPESRLAEILSTPAEFEAHISQGITLVHFCTRTTNTEAQPMAVIFHQLATMYSRIPEIKVVQVECHNEDMKGLCENEEVKSHPTVMLYKNGHLKSTYNDDLSKATTEKLMQFIHKARLAKDEL